jgi:hypothetical protein
MPTELQDLTTDVTLATEVTEAPAVLPASPAAGAPVRPEEDRTVFVDPVEQAILVDRTRQPRKPAASKPAPIAAAGEVDAGSISDDTTIDVRALDQPVSGSGEAAAEVDGEGEGDSDSLLGNYRVVAPLAGLSPTPLLLAEHSTMGFPVAIKMLPPALVGSPDAEARFFAEAVVAARVAHPGVPMVLDYGHDQRGIAYLAREYLPGDNLAANLARGSTFTLEQVLEIGAQVAAVLAAAHAVGVHHGDVRPDNVHLCPDPALPGGLRVKLLELGVADPPVVAAAAWYRAPEQSGDVRADVYSVGCVLYQLLAGRPPLDGTGEEVAQGLRAVDPPPPSFHRPDIPWPVDSLVHRMIAPRPHERPGSMAEVEAELRGLLAGPPAAAPAPVRSGRGALQSIARAFRSLGRADDTVATASPWQRMLAGARRAAVHHPRASVAVITLALFLAAIGLVALIR